MFILDFFSRLLTNTTTEKIDLLEKKVVLLENALCELSNVTKRVTLLSIKTSQELDNLVKFLQKKEHEELDVFSEKKDNDFYN